MNSVVNLQGQSNAGKLLLAEDVLVSLEGLCSME